MLICNIIFLRQKGPHGAGLCKYQSMEDTIANPKSARIPRLSKREAIESFAAPRITKAKKMTEDFDTSGQDEISVFAAALSYVLTSGIFGQFDKRTFLKLSKMYLGGSPVHPLSRLSPEIVNKYYSSAIQHLLDHGKVAEIPSLIIDADDEEQYVILN